MMGVMDPEEADRAYFLAARVADAVPGATTVRYSDASGPAAFDDPRLNQQLEIIVGRRLSQFSMSGSGVRLAFWGEKAGTIGREILIEHETLDLTQPGQRAAIRHQWNEDVVATSLLAALNNRVTRIDVTDGHLSVTFESGLQLEVEPDQQYESWQITSEDDLLIVCTPGGDLTIWYPVVTS